MGTRKESEDDFFKKFDSEKSNEFKAKQEKERADQERLQLLAEKKESASPSLGTPTISGEDGMPSINAALNVWGSGESKPSAQLTTSQPNRNVDDVLGRANIKAVENLSLNDADKAESENSMEKSTTSIDSMKLVSLKSAKSSMKKTGKGAKGKSRFGGAKVKNVDMKKLETEAKIAVETGVSQQKASEPVVTTEKRSSLQSARLGMASSTWQRHANDRTGRFTIISFSILISMQQWLTCFFSTSITSSQLFICFLPLQVVRDYLFQ